MFKSLTLYGLTQSSIQGCNRVFRPATLGSCKDLIVHVGYCPIGNIKTWVVDFDTETLCAFSILLASMGNLKTFTLKLTIPTNLPRAVSMFRTYASWDWTLVVWILSQTHSLQGREAAINIELCGVYLRNGQAVISLAKFLRKFASVTISHLSIEIDDRSQRRTFRPASLLKLKSLKHINQVEITADGYESVFGIAANLPTTVLKLQTSEDWDTPISSSALAFPQLRSIEMDCRNEPYAVFQILSLLHTPCLRSVSLCNMDDRGCAIILGAQLARFLRRCTTLIDIKIGLIPAEEQWSDVQCRLEELRLIIIALGKRLRLGIDYWETPDGHAVSRSRTGQAVPLSEPLQAHIEELDFGFDEDSTQPMYRAIRARLPSVRELTLRLRDGLKDIGILQWYLDGLDLPKLSRLTVELGCGPGPFQLILAHLPLLPSCCSVRLQYVRQWSPRGVEVFRRSKDYAALNASCLSLGIDLTFAGEYWTIPLGPEEE